jgi:hypothetical protein
MGIPLTPQEMVRTVPPAENAAPIYARAIVAYTSIGEPKLAGFRSPRSTASELAEHGKLVLKHAPTLKLVEEASRKPFCEWNRDWSLGPFLLFPERGSLFGFAKLIASKAYLESELGDFESAFRWLQTGLRSAHQTREPGDHWTTIRCEEVILAEFQHLLNEHGDSARFRLLAHKFLANLGSLPSLREDVKGNLVSARVALKGLAEARPGFEMNSMSHGGPSYEDQAVTYTMRLGSVRSSVEARVLKHFRQQIEAMSARTYAQRQQRAIALDQRMESDRSWHGRIAGFFSPSFEPASAAYVRLDANRRLCRSALELWDIKAVSGAFPLQENRSWLQTLQPRAKHEGQRRSTEGLFDSLGRRRVLSPIEIGKSRA